MSLTKYVYSVRPIRVVDGDTIEVDIDLGWETHKIAHIRMNGVNAPEHNTPNGPVAAKFFADTLELTPDQRLLLKSEVYDKYGRTVGHLWPAAIADPTPENSINSILEKHYVDTGISTVFHRPAKAQS